MKNLEVMKYLVKECNVNVNGESSVVVDLAVATQTLIIGKSSQLVTVFARA